MSLGNNLMSLFNTKNCIVSLSILGTSYMVFSYRNIIKDRLNNFYSEEYLDDINPNCPTIGNTKTIVLDENQNEEKSEQCILTDSENED